MEQFKTELYAMFLWVLHNPPEAHQQVVVALAATVFGVLAFLQVCDKMDFHSLGLISGLYHAVQAGGLVLAAMTAAKLYLPPWARILDERGLLLAAAGIASVAGAVPFLNQVTQGRYWCTLLAWVVGVGVFIGSVYGVNYLYVSGRLGQEAIERVRKTSVQAVPAREFDTCSPHLIG